MSLLVSFSTPSRQRAVIAVVLATGLWTAGCTAHRRPATPAEPALAEQAPVEQVPVQQTPAEPAPAEQVPAEQAPAEPATVAPEPEPPAGSAETEPPKPPGLHELCHQEIRGEGEFLDETRRMLEETFCGATLWFDGLFGGEPDPRNARAASGRVELSALYTEAGGFEPRGRLRLRYDLPNLERRVNLFLGRDDRDELVEDRQEGFAIRSSVFGLGEEQWLAGLGYSPPGRFEKRLDFRVGTRMKTSPEVFAQTRYRRNFFHGTSDVWRFRETVFWENDDGFGSTTSIDFDRVLRRNLLFRWGSAGTFSESIDGMSWRMASLLYHNLRRSRAVAGEIFVRGTTGDEVKLREYGTRAIYRQPVGKPFLFGELIVGYTWPRFERDEPREGSAMLGLGIELLFGRDPF